MQSSLMNRRVLGWLGAVGLCAATILVYRLAWHGGFIWDDDRYVTNNYLLIAPDGLRRIWFSLRVGSSSNPALNSAWAQHGADAFSFEPLEALEDEELPYVRDTRLKERAIHWRTRLNASTI